MVSHTELGQKMCRRRPCMLTSVREKSANLLPSLLTLLLFLCLFKLLFLSFLLWFWTNADAFLKDTFLSCCSESSTSPCEYLQCEHCPSSICDAGFWSLLLPVKVTDTIELMSSTHPCLLFTQVLLEAPARPAPYTNYCMFDESLDGCITFIYWNSRNAKCFGL